MIPFISIPEHLQVKIAEQMLYVDQEEFELSSKRGTNVLNATFHKAVVEVTRIDVEYDPTVVINDINLKRQVNLNKFWSQLREHQHLPRFNVNRLVIWEEYQLNAIEDIGEKLELVNSGTHLQWRVGQLPADMFLLLCQIFPIRGVTCTAAEIFNSKLFSVERFSEMEHLEIPITNINYETLLQLNARSLILHEYSERRIETVGIFFFQKWFMKQLQVDWFRITKYCECPINKKDFLSNLPRNNEIIWQSKENSRNKTTIIFMNTKDCAKQYDLEKDDVIVSLDRGDKKLLILVSVSSDLIVALEYNNVRDIMDIEEIKE